MDYETALIDALRRGKLSFGGGGGSVPNGISAGGRLGYTVPVGDGEVDLGLSGGGVYSKNFKGAKAQSLDAEYRKGDQAFGLEFQRGNPGGGFSNNMPVPATPDMMWLKYRKTF